MNHSTISNIFSLENKLEFDLNGDMTAFQVDQDSGLRLGMRKITRKDCKHMIRVAT